MPTGQRRPERLPVVLTRAEVRALLAHLDGDKHLMASLLYGAGLRVSEVCALKVSHIDSARMQIRVEQGKGNNYAKVVVMQR